MHKRPSKVFHFLAVNRLIEKRFTKKSMPYPSRHSATGKSHNAC